MAVKTNDTKTVKLSNFTESGIKVDAKGKNAIRIDGLAKADVKNLSFKIVGKNLIISTGDNKRLIVSNYSGIKYIKTDYKKSGKNVTYKLTDIISSEYVINTANIPYNKTKKAYVGTKYNDTFTTNPMKNDTFTGGLGKNTFNYSHGGGKDTINLTNTEDLTINLTDISATEVSLAYKNNNKDLVIYTNAEKTESITLKNYGAKNVVGSKGSVIIKTTDNEEGINLKTITIANNVKSHFTGTWHNDYIDASGVTKQPTKTITKTVKGKKVKQTVETPVSLNGGGGNDTIIGSAFKDSINGGAGNDTITATVGNDTIVGGKGTNVINYTYDAEHTDFGNDVIKLTKGETLNINIEGDGVDLSYARGTGKNKNDLIITNNKNPQNKLTIKNYYGKELGATVLINDKDLAKDFVYNSIFYFDKTKVSSNKITSSALADVIDAREVGKQYKTVTKTVKGKKKKVKQLTNLIIKSGGGNDQVIGSAYKDSILGGNGNDTLSGRGGNDTIKGGNGNDVIAGGAGNDKLYGGAGNDRFEFSSMSNEGNDIVYSGKGTDTLSFYDAEISAISFAQGKGKNKKDLIIKYQYNDNGTIGTASVTVKNYYTVNKKGKITGINKKNSVKKIFIGGNTYNLANVITASGKINGTTKSDLIIGSSNNDTIYAKEGNDTIVGGKGDDKITVDKGSNTVIINKGDGQDSISGAASSDGLTINLNSEIKNIYGYQNGADYVIARYYASDVGDIIERTVLQNFDYATSKDKITLNYNDLENVSLSEINLENFDPESSDIGVLDGDGNFSGSDDGMSYVVTGDDRDNNITTGSGDDSINAGEGDNVITSNGGNNSITSGSGGDSITVGGDGNNTISSGGGNDTINVNSSGTNTVDTGDGADEVNITNGTNTVNTGDGADRVSISGGANTVNTGDGKDNVTISGGTNTINTGDGEDTVSITGGSNGVNLGGGSDTINVGAEAGATTVYGGNGSDSITVNNSNSTIYGGNQDGTDTGANTINANTGGDHEIHAGTYENEGNLGDTITAGNNNSGNFTIYGGGNNDSIDASNSNKATIYGGDGNDTIKSGHNGPNSIDGGVGSDNITVYGDANTVYGGSGSDTINLDGVTGTGKNYVYGGEQPAQGEDYDGTDTAGNKIDAKNNGVNEIWAGNGNPDDPYHRGDTITVGKNDGNYSSQNTVHGGSANDSINGQYSGALLVDGGDGNDTINGSLNGHSSINGGDGRDQISIYGDYNSINGGDGDDVIFSMTSVVSQGVNSNITLRGGKGDDNLVLSNTNAAETLMYYAEDTGHDHITPSIGAGSQTDKLIFSDIDTNDLYVRVTGTNLIISYNKQDDNTFASSVTIDNFFNNDGSINENCSIRYIQTNDGIFNNQSRIENFINTRSIIYANSSTYNNNTATYDGSIYNENITGADTLPEGFEYQVIKAGAGNDTVTGGAGNTSINGGAGNDIINGGAGNATLNGGGGNDHLYSGSGNDVFFFESDSLAGTDTIHSGSGNDTIKVDALFENEVTDKNFTRNGNDLIITTYNENETTSKVVVSGFFSNPEHSAKYVQYKNHEEALSLRDMYIYKKGVAQGSDGVSISAEDYNDFIEGTDYNDTISAIGLGTKENTYNDIAQGGRGNDTYNVADNGYVKININNGDGNDIITNAANAKKVIINFGSAIGDGLLNGYQQDSDYILERHWKDNEDVWHTETITLQGFVYNESTNPLIEIYNGSDTATHLSDYNAGGAVVHTFDNSFSTSADDTVSYFVIGSDAAVGDTITTGLGNDTVYSYSGNDSINAGGGNNTVVSDGNGTRTITSGNGNDTITTSGGTSTVSIEGGSNTVTTGSGNDTITIGGYGGTNVVNAGDGANTLSIEGGANTITSGSGSDVIVADGTASNNITTSGQGNQITVNGGAVSTINVNNSSGQNIIDSYAYNANTVNVTGNNNEITVSGGESTNVTIKADDNIANPSYNTITVNEGMETHVSIEGGGSANTVNMYAGGDSTITGSSGADTINIYYGSNVINATGGADQISITGGYQNTVNMGNAEDATVTINPDYEETSTVINDNGKTNTYDISEGTNTLNLSIGENQDPDNVLIYGGHNIINGSSGADSIVSVTGGENVFNLGAGDDHISTSVSTTNTIYGGLGADGITAIGASTVYGGTNEEGNDDASNSIMIGGYSALVYAGNGVAGTKLVYNETTGDYDTVDCIVGDFITTNDEYMSEAVIYGGIGDDVIYTNYANSASIYGGNGDDSISGSYIGNTYVEAGEGDDFITIYNGNMNSVYGGAGNDFISVDGGNREYSEPKTAYIDGGTGNDKIYLTGDFTETINFNNGDGQDTICSSSGSSGSDTLMFSSQYLDGLVVNYRAEDSSLVITYNNGEDSVTLDNLLVENGRLITSVGYINVNGFGESSVSFLELMNQRSVYTLTPYDEETGAYFEGLGYSEHITGTALGDTIYGNRSSATTSGADTIDGGDGNDVIYGDNGSNSLYGGDGNDTIYGGCVYDTIYGGAGNDYIEDKEGTNYIIGGTGNDTINALIDDPYSYTPSNTLIFNTGDDTDMVFNYGNKTTFEFYVANYSQLHITYEYIKTTEYNAHGGYCLVIQYGDNPNDKVILEDFSTVSNKDAYVRFYGMGETAMLSDILYGSVFNSILIPEYPAAENATITGSDYSDEYIYATNYHSTIIGGGGNDTIESVGNCDEGSHKLGNVESIVYKFDKTGSGNDVIVNARHYYNTSEIVFTGFSTAELADEEFMANFYESISYTKSGNDLVISYGTDSSITIRDYCNDEDVRYSFSSFVAEDTEGNSQILGSFNDIPPEVQSQMNAPQMANSFASNNSITSTDIQELNSELASWAGTKADDVGAALNEPSMKDDLIAVINSQNTNPQNDVIRYNI